MAGSVKVGGAWKTVSGASVKVGGAWKTVSAGYTKVGGAWKQWYSGNQFFIGVTEVNAFPTESQRNASSSSYSGKSALAFSSNASSMVYSINNSGDLLWQRKFYNSVSGGFGNAAVDPSGNIIYTSAGNIVKFDPNGNITAQRVIANTVAKSAVGANASGELAFATRIHGGSWSSGYVSNSRYNSSLVQQVINVYAHNRNAVVTVSGLDSSGNIYTACQTAPSSYAYYGFQINKFNSAGTIQWTRMIENSGTAIGVSEKRGGHVDPSGNVYLGLRTGNPYSTSSADYCGLIKYNTNGTLMYQKYISGYGAKGQPVATSDNGGNAYCVFASGTGVLGEGLIIFKVDSSGNLVWQRTIKNTAGNYHDVHEIYADNNGAIIISGRNEALDHSFFFKLPADGSKTGTYTLGSMTYNYAAGSGTFGSFGYGEVAGYGSANAFAATESAGDRSTVTTTTTFTKAVI